MRYKAGNIVVLAIPAQIDSGLGKLAICP